MSDTHSPAGMIEPELLVATCAGDGSILSRNSAWQRLFGTDAFLWAGLTREDADLAEQNLKEAADGSLVTNALFLVNQAGRDIPTPVLINFIPVSDTSSDSSFCVAISGEILAEPSSWTESQTQRHRMETLGRMTMGMTHDFNNLLSGILGHIELWRLEGLNDDQGHLATIEQAAKDGANLIGKVQRYIRQEVQQTFEVVELSALIQECISFTRPYWYNEPRRQGIDIEVVNLIDTALPIEGSPAELRDVFVNLILNAVHALPKGGKITFDGSRTDSQVVISVGDNGVGMAPEVKKRVFEPLFSTKGAKGTGMGLAVAAGILREHAGSVDVISKLGVGTTFRMLFPASNTRTSTPAVPVTSQASSQPKRLLVVDDEAMVRNIINKLLSLRGHHVTVAASGPEALEGFKKNAFDYVITDQGMPEMSGRELAIQLRKISATIPIILLTGDTDLKVDSDIINFVMTKPFKLDELEAALTSLS